VSAPQSRLRRKLSDALALNPEILAKGLENAGAGTQRVSRVMSVKMLARIEAEMKALRTQGQEAALDNTERGSMVSGSNVQIEKKRSLREARSRPWADFLAGKNKNKNKTRLKRHFSAANTIALDLEGLKAHIQATRQTVEEAEEWFRQHRLKQEQKALEAANSEAGVDGSSSCEKKRPPGLNLLARTPGSAGRSPAGAFYSMASPLVLQMARTRRLRMRVGGGGSSTNNSPQSPHLTNLKSPYSPSMKRGAKIWGIARSRFRLHECLNHTLTPSSRRRAGLQSPALSASTPGTCKSVRSASGTGTSGAGGRLTEESQKEEAQKVPEHSPHPSKRYMPGVGQVWVLTKKGKIVKVIGKSLPPDKPAHHHHSDMGAQVQTQAHVGHRPQALF